MEHRLRCIGRALKEGAQLRSSLITPPRDYGVDAASAENAGRGTTLQTLRWLVIDQKVLVRKIFFFLLHKRYACLPSRLKLRLTYQNGEGDHRQRHRQRARRKVRRSARAGACCWAWRTSVGHAFEVWMDMRRLCLDMDPPTRGTFE